MQGSGKTLLSTERADQVMTVGGSAPHSQEQVVKCSGRHACIAGLAIVQVLPALLALKATYLWR